MSRKGEVILVSGPIGAGKSTVSRLLVAKWPRPACHIEGDRFWAFIGERNHVDRRTQFTILMRSMVAASIPFARSGYDVVLDFSIPPQFLDTARKILKEVPLRYVVLMPDEATCAARAANRAEGAIADYSGYREFYALFAEAADCVTGIEETSPSEIAEYLCQALADGQFRC